MSFVNSTYKPLKESEEFMKKYKIFIEYTEYKGGKTMKTTVNGENKKIPNGVRKWIAEDFISESFYLAEKMGFWGGLIK